MVSEINKPEDDDVFKDEEVPKSFEKEMEDDTGGWTEVKDTGADELPTSEEKEDLVPDKIIHETAVGKGLSGALQLLKERGTLKETIDWGGRNMDKKKSKLVGIYENDGTKEIRIERTDEFGRIVSFFIFFSKHINMFFHINMFLLWALYNTNDLMLKQFNCFRRMGNWT